MRLFVYLCDKAHTMIQTHHHYAPVLGPEYFAAVAILNTYVVHDLYSLDAYTLRTLHEQDSVVVRHKRTSYTCAIACMLYSM